MRYLHVALTIFFLLLTTTVASQEVSFEQFLKQKAIEYKNPSMTDAQDLVKCLKQAKIDALILKKIYDITYTNYDDIQYVLELNSVYQTFLSQGRLEKLADSLDPALIRLRDEVKLPIPTGFAYIIIDKAEESEIDKLYTTFISSSTGPTEQGITYFSRYIVLQERYDPALIFRANDAKTKVLSHELVHVYVNALVGNEPDDLPKWFTEGLAIYYAKNLDSEVIDRKQSAGGNTIETIAKLPPEYISYRKVFYYLVTFYGKEKFYDFIRQSISDRSVDKTLPALVGHKNEKRLIQDAEKFDKDKTNFYLIFVVWSIWVFLSFVVLFQSFEEETKALPRGVKIGHLINALAFISIAVILYLNWSMPKIIIHSWFD